MHYTVYAADHWHREQFVSLLYVIVWLKAGWIGTVWEQCHISLLCLNASNMARSRILRVTVKSHILSYCILLCLHLQVFSAVVYMLLLQLLPLMVGSPDGFSSGQVTSE